MLLRKIILFVFIFVGSVLTAQNTNNPFDINGRSSDKELLADSSFIESLNALENPTNENSTQSSDNPFDVSHIPLKKTEIKKAPSRKSRTDNSFVDFQFWTILVLLIIFSILMFLFREQIFGLIKPLLNNNYLSTLMRESDNGKNPFFIGLYIFFIINLSLLVYNLLEYLEYVSNNLTWFLYLILAVTLVYLCKHSYLYIIGNIFPLKKPLSTYGFTSLIFNSILGIFLLPINILAILGPENIQMYFLFIGLGTVVIVYLIRLFRGFLISSNVATSGIFHFFLYLCSSEIAPLALIYSFIVNGF